MGSTMAQKLDEPFAVTQLLLQRTLTDLSGTSPGDTIVSSLKKSLSEVSKATDILNRFQSTAQVSGETTTEPIDIYQITKRLITIFAQTARRANLALAVKDVDTVLNLSIPPRQLEQVFFILIQSTIDRANIKKDQKLTISCRHISNELVELKFSDTCSEIKQPKLQHIFDPYFAAERGTGEIGFGLTVAKQIIRDHGGDITAQSQPDQGTVFCVTLPIKQK